METVFGETLARQRFLLLLLVTFGGVALTLAAVGTYGVVSYLVTQRRREIGIRVALGARTREVMRLVVAEGLGAASIGVAIGLGGALAFGKVTQSLLFAVSPTDPGTYSVVAITILVAALLASLVPAYRALRIDPLEAIRSE